MSTPISSKNGFVSKPTNTPQKPVRPGQPVAPGTIALMNQNGKEVTKKVKG